ncbi:ANTAR domain-containing protein [Nocardia takedensis]|uniref:ANTAR domain-containing protein n=1 Tax=Nocardia takedensis TaxID=259390 RepID=UPI0002DD65D9|nr:ANTAR domain-containing protein [Nocardia takedensis]
MEDYATLDGDEAAIAAARQVIEQAKGAVMLVYGVRAEEAFTILRAASQATNVKAREVAAMVVEHLPRMGAPSDLAALRVSLDRVLFGPNGHGAPGRGRPRDGKDRRAR